MIHLIRSMGNVGNEDGNVERPRLGFCHDQRHTLYGGNLMISERWVVGVPPSVGHTPPRAGNAAHERDMPPLWDLS